MIHTPNSSRHRDTIINIPNPSRRSTISMSYPSPTQPSKTALDHSRPKLGNNSSTFQSKPSPKSGWEEMENELIWDETPLTTCQQSVLRIIQQYGITTAEGVSMTTILQNARKEGITEKETVYEPIGGKRLIDSSTVYQLLSNGHTYNTVDSSHFKPTNLY